MFANPETTHISSTDVFQKWALVNPRPSESLAETRKRLAKERFHPVAVAEQHLAIYREVLSSKSDSNGYRSNTP